MTETEAGVNYASASLCEITGVFSLDGGRVWDWLKVKCPKK